MSERQGGSERVAQRQEKAMEKKIVDSCATAFRFVIYHFMSETGFRTCCCGLLTAAIERNS